MADPRTTFGVLGEITFRADESPSAIAIKQSTGFAQLPRIGQKPLTQATGDNLTELSLTFEFAAGWCNPDDNIRRLQELMNAQEPLYFGFGGGRYDGYYLIESIGSTVADTLPTGELLTASVGVTLIETLDRPTTVQVPANFVEVR